MQHHVASARTDLGLAILRAVVGAHGAHGAHGAQKPPVYGLGGVNGTSGPTARAGIRSTT